MKSKFLLAAAALTFSACTTSASANTVTLSYEGTGPFNGGAYSNIYVNYNGSTEHVSAGGFHMKDQDGNTLIAWCLDLLDYLTPSHTYETTNTPFWDNDITSRTANIQKFFEVNYSTAGLLTNNVMSAGFQLALWELVYEDAGNSLDAGSGTLKASSAPWYGWGLGSVVAQANTFLGKLGDAITQPYDLTYYDSKGQVQDLVSASDPSNNVPQVPLPAAGWLLGGGLLGLAGLSRRKKSGAMSAA